MVLLAVVNGEDTDREHMIVANHNRVYLVKTQDFWHSVKPTRQQVAFCCDVDMEGLKSSQQKPRLDSLSEISHMRNVGGMICLLWFIFLGWWYDFCVLEFSTTFLYPTL